MSIKIIQNLNFTAFSVNFTPVYNFINDTPEIYLDINALLENHIKHFPDASSTEEIKNLYPHETFCRFTERELHLVENYIKNTNIWNRELLLDLKKLIKYLAHASFSLQSPYVIIIKSKQFLFTRQLFNRPAV